MMTKAKHKTLIICASIVLMLAISTPVLAKEERGGQHDEHASKTLQTLKQTVVIQKKTPEVIISSILERFLVSESTIIVGMDGKQVLYRNMLVPCEAEVTYVATGGEISAHRIKIKRIGAQAKKHFFFERPE